jgi:cyanophycin synthetase
VKETKPDARYEIILDETAAIETALDSATPGSLVVILPESVTRAINLIEARNAVQVMTPVASPNPVKPQIVASREAVPTP